MELIINISETVKTLISEMPYFRIFFFMAIESSFIPFPSEIVMIPAGYFASQGKINLIMAILCGISGSIVGAILNYSLAKYFGCKISKKLMGEKNHDLCIKFFGKYGDITTFIGRLIPVIRQYISFPAGLFKMPIGKFILYTGIGAGIWVSFLAILGWYIGENEALFHKYKVYFILGVILIALIVIRLKLFLFKKIIRR